jgi:tetratricopeptide (TPR) repeat protein/S1-C subfamily serine protease
LATAQRAAAKITVRVRVGQGGGSGVLLAKKGGTYLVLTNAHVVQGQAGVSITTPDGQVYGARRVQNAQVGDFDLALLEFNSARAYGLAKFANFENRDASLKEDRELFAAGFPYDANGLKLLGGRITQLPQEAFKNGTQVGYVTQGDLVQGMSGGPVLDSFGNLVGINSTLARPVIDSYVYADGSKAPDDKVAEYRQANWSVPMYNLLTRLNPDVLYSYQQLPKLHRSITPTGYMAELDRKARAVTVRIERGRGGNGSGVIVARDGNSYYVLTADHVVKNSNGLKVVTHDQRVYQISDGDVKRSEGTDLAVVKFTSNENYRSATLGNYSIADGSIVFPGGWPAPNYINSQQWQWQINPGIISDKEQGEFLTQDRLSFSNGYDLIYSSITYGGMSGGAVFDHAGRVIGIHGQAEGNRASKNILGQSLGISIGTFIGLAERLNVLKRLQIETTPPDTITEKQFKSIDLARNNIAIPTNNSDPDQWIEYGNQLYRVRKYTDAVKAFNQGIIVNPTSLNAYYGKGLALKSNGNLLEALVIFDQSINLIPPNNQSSYYYLWRSRSVVLRGLQRYSEALMAISQAINLEPKDTIILNEKANLLKELKRYPEAIETLNEIIKRSQKSWTYNNRGSLKDDLGDKKGAILDYSRAISLNSKDYRAYNNRGVSKSDLGDKKESIIDFDKAISINPKYEKAYSNRGNIKSDLGNDKEAIFDFDRAVNLNPQFAIAYHNRGRSKYNLGDKRGAIIDYDRAINLNPKYADAYNNRGVLKSALGDEKGAVTDLDRAISLNPQLAIAYHNRGHSKYNSGDKKGAIADLDRAVVLNPNSVESYYTRGSAKSELGDNKGAIFDFDKFISVNPKHFHAYHNRGLAQYKLGNKREAILDFNQAININPKYTDAYNNRGLVKSDLNDNKGAIIDFDRAITTDSKNVEIYINRGNTKSKLGDKKAAILDFDKAININPKYAIAYYSRGVVKFESGNAEEARFDYDKAISIDPKLHRAYLNRGVIKYKSGNREGAILDFDRVISIDSKNAEAYVNRGNIKLELENKKEAILDYNQAVIINPQFTIAYLNRGLAKYSLGDSKGAINDLKIAAQLFKSQNNQQLYDNAIDLIRKFSNP